MGVFPDWMIRRDVVIEDAQPGIKRAGKISYGYTSYGYDARIGYIFQMIKPYPCSEIDPKNFDKDMYDTVDLTPTYNHQWEDSFAGQSLEMGKRHCMNCGAFEGTPSEKSMQCPTRKSGHIVIPPNSFVLGETMETFTIPRDCLCIVLGKSTYARCGLTVNVTPGEPEWRGKWTVEISNTTPKPARVYCGEGIMQCIFLRTDGRREKLDIAVRQLIALTNPHGSGELLLKDYLASMHGASCEVSYKDKQGKYQDQAGLTNPMVDKGENK